MFNWPQKSVIIVRLADCLLLDQNEFCTQPFLCYMDNLINMFKTSGYGHHVDNVHFVCLVCADMLISHSFIVIQHT